MELNSNLYVGGIASSKRSKAISQGVSGANHAASGTYGGLRGCIHQIELDGRKIGLPEVMETSDIQAGCVWDYPCLSKTGSPCIEGSVCFQQGTSGFRCECDDQVCTKPNSYERPNINEDKDDIDAVSLSVFCFYTFEISELLCKRYFRDIKCKLIHFFSGLV